MNSCYIYNIYYKPFADLRKIDGYTHAFAFEFATAWDRDWFVEKDLTYEEFPIALHSQWLADMLVIYFSDGVM